VTYSDFIYADRLMNTYVKIATSSPVIQELRKRLDILATPHIEVESVPSTELIKISVDSADPGLAQAAANTLAEILVEQGKELYSGGGKSPLEILEGQLPQAEAELKQARSELENLVAQSPEAAEEIEAANQTVELKEKTYAYLLDQYDQASLRETMRANIITIVEPAVMPLSPIKPRKLMNISLGVLIGLCGGIGLAFLFENLNKRVYSSDLIESITGMKLLSKIPNVESKLLLLPKSGNIQSDMLLSESFTRLRTNIFTFHQNGSKSPVPRTLMITSAVPGEGKSTISTHLALVTIQNQQKVILVDADMRAPNLHKYFGLSNKVGLSNILNQTVRLEDAILPSRYPGLNLITSGPLPPNPTVLLGSRKMKELIAELISLYNVVIIDTPAYLPVTDASVLAPIMDGVILVCRRNFTREEEVREVSKQLYDIKARKIGVVVNDAEQNRSYYYYRSRGS